MVRGPHFEKGCVRSSHLVVRGNHTHWHPISISTDTESISIAVRYRSNILFIAKDDIMHKKKRQNCEKCTTCTHYTYKCAYNIFRMLDFDHFHPPTHPPTCSWSCRCNLRWRATRWTDESRLRQKCRAPGRSDTLLHRSWGLTGVNLKTQGFVVKRHKQCTCVLTWRVISLRYAKEWRAVIKY